MYVGVDKFVLTKEVVKDLYLSWVVGTLISVHEAYLEEITSLQHSSLRVEDVAPDACGLVCTFQWLRGLQWVL